VLDPGAVPRCDSGGTGDTRVYVLDGIGAASPLGGVLDGFDLDGRVSDRSDAESCFHEDLTSPPPESVPGIDSQINVALVEVGLDDNFEDGYRETVGTGELIPLVVVEGIDDSSNDDCVHASLVFGRLPVGVAGPRVDAEGRYEPDQTFDVRAEWLAADRVTARVRFLDGAITDGTLVASALEARIEAPAPPDTIVVAIPVYDVHLRLALSDAMVTGALGGALAGHEFVDVLEPVLDPVLLNTLGVVFYEQADLQNVMGTCTCASLTWRLAGVPAMLGAVVD
jgi:hypothetical protein